MPKSAVEAVAESVNDLGGDVAYVFGAGEQDREWIEALAEGRVERTAHIEYAGLTEDGRPWRVALVSADAQPPMREPAIELSPEYCEALELWSAAREALEHAGKALVQCEVAYDIANFLLKEAEVANAAE